MKRTGNAANPARFPRPLHFVVEKFVVEKHVACRAENGALMPRAEATGAVAIASDRTFPARRAAWIGIGGSLTAPPLPHHRTYGSVYGGSVDYAGRDAATEGRP